MFQYLRFLQPSTDFSVARGVLKGFFLIAVGRVLLDGVQITFPYRVPNYCSRVDNSHPINPPIYEPFRYEQPEEYQEYLELVQKVLEIGLYTGEGHYFKKLSNPALEDSFIIKEALFESETERVFDEIRTEIRRKIRAGTNKEFASNHHEVEKRVLFKRFEAQIKPAV